MTQQEMDKIFTWKKQVHEVRINSDSATPTRIVTGWYAQRKGMRPRGPFKNEQTAIDTVKRFDF